MTGVRNISPGDNPFDNVLSAGWVNELVDKVNSGVDDGKQVIAYSSYTTALTDNRIGTNQNNKAGQAKQGYSSGELTKESFLGFPIEYVLQSDGAGNEFYPTFGSWHILETGDPSPTPMIGGIATNRLYVNGIFQAKIKYTNGGHRYCDIQQLPYSAARPDSEPLISCSFGSARIVERERTQHVYANEADRLGELSYTVTEEDIENKVLFGQDPNVVDQFNLTSQPRSFWRATGAPGAVVWNEADDVDVLLERPCQQLPVQAWEIDDRFASSTIPANTTTELHFKFSDPLGTDWRSDLTLYNEDVAGKPERINAWYHSWYRLTLAFDGQINQTLGVGGSGAVALRIVGRHPNNAVSSQATITLNENSPSGRQQKEFEAIVLIDQMRIAQLEVETDANITISNATFTLTATPVRLDRPRLV